MSARCRPSTAQRGSSKRQKTERSELGLGVFGPQAEMVFHCYNAGDQLVPGVDDALVDWTGELIVFCPVPGADDQVEVRLLQPRP